MISVRGARFQSIQSGEDLFSNHVTLPTVSCPNTNTTRLQLTFVLIVNSSVDNFFCL